jgi:hypothetical protein
MNLDDVEAQPFGDWPNTDGAVDQSVRADSLGFRRYSENAEVYTTASEAVLSPALRHQKTCATSCRVALSLSLILATIETTNNKTR